MKDRCGFENFIQLECNQKAYELFISTAASVKIGANPILLSGQTGTGKTHLLLALRNAVAAQGKSVLYQSGDEFVAALVESIQNKRQDDFFALYLSYSFLMLDDVQTLSQKRSTIEEMFQFMRKHLPSIQIVLAGSFCGQEGIWFTQEVETRFAEAATVILGMPSYEDRQIVLEKQLSAKGITIAPNSLANLAREKTSIRQLEGVANSLYAAKALSVVMK